MAPRSVPIQFHVSMCVGNTEKENMYLLSFPIMVYAVGGGDNGHLKSQNIDWIKAATTHDNCVDNLAKYFIG